MSDEQKAEDVNKGIDKGVKPYNEYTKLHAYSGGNPKGLGTSEVETWLHLSKDLKDKTDSHAELVGDLRYVASDDYDITEQIDLLHLNSDQFSEILLSHVLDYIEWKNQEDFLIYIWNLLSDYGRLKIVTRNFDVVRDTLIKKKNRFLKAKKVDDWRKQMHLLYSSTCPMDQFACCHTKATLKESLLKASFGNIMIKETGDHLEVTCVKSDV